MNRYGWIGLAVVAGSIVAGCRGNASGGGGRTAANAGAATKPGIGPQFWKYDLSEYRLDEQDSLGSLGGRWASRRYERKNGASVTRAGMVERITAALIADGWKPVSLPETKYVLSRIWQQSGKDLGFTRTAREGEESNWFFNQFIYISDDAKVLCIYCEVGW